MKKLLRLLCALILLFTLNTSFAIDTNNKTVFNPHKNQFSIAFNEHTIKHNVFGAYVLPNETVTIKVNKNSSNDDYSIKTDNGKLTHTNATSWTWHTPKSIGVHPILIKNNSSGEQTIINAFVVEPITNARNGKLKNFQIGNYPNQKKNTPAYQAPKGLIKVTKENQHIKIAPHFTLKQFLCKQTNSFPQYVVLQEKLLLKLEWLLEQVNMKGIQASSFYIMSGYRTPFYNRSLGNVTNSRHLYGDAADIFIDENKDGMMDDINKDGKINFSDISIIYNLIEKSHSKPFYKPFIGGLGRYRRNSKRGPFVHIDTRGYRARWGS